MDNVRDEPLSNRSVRYWLTMLIEATALPVHGVVEAEDRLRNIHEDLLKIKVSLELNGGLS